ncbi:Ferredoxin reductase [Rhodococcus wratislaviensis]|uniref:Ferredoxin reductase n=2 Tax=Rhodococcus wratislaviensis TaxID=44752 RepID=A0A402CKV5_RHOWR|nr:Ferredoxin reductase [Rhodococcus wratislaviensis]
MEPSQAFLQSADAWDADGVELRLSTTVTRIDPGGGELHLDSGATISVDKVLLCTGGHVRRLDVAGAHLEGVEYLRTLDDAVSIRSALEARGSVVVVGGGFIGAEVAACARQAGCDVTLLEIEDVPLWRVLGRELGSIVTEFHRSEGIRILANTGLASIGGRRSVQYVETTNGERIDADLVVIGVGVVPATELAEGAGIGVCDGILVDEYCRTSNPNVFAAGDVANHPNDILGHRVRLEHWQNAQNQAAAAACSMLGIERKFREVPWFWSDQYDVSIQMSGYPSPTDSVLYRGDPTSRSFSAFFLRDGILRSTFGVNRSRDVKRTMQFIESQVALDAEELSDESVDLRKIEPLIATV